jgi:hypothetical protein
MVLSYILELGTMVHLSLNDNPGLGSEHSSRVGYRRLGSFQLAFPGVELLLGHG